MVTPKIVTYDADWGSTLGGSVLYMEPMEYVRSNRRRTFAASVVMFGLGMAFFILIWITLTDSNASEKIPVIGGSIFGAILCIIMGALAFQEARGLRPFAVYERGFMLRMGKKPFIQYKDVYHVEEERTLKGNSPFTLITLTNSAPIIITGDPFIRHVHACLKDYEKVKNLIVERVNEEGVRHMEWGAEAKSFMSGLEYAKGPVMAATEKVAREKGRGQIDIGFIASNWKEITKEAGFFNYYFKKAAKKAFKK
jgi:hypothetical protein